MPAPIRNTTPRSPEKHKGRTHYGTGSAPKGGHTAPAPVVKTPVRVVTPSGKSYVPKATTKRLKKINAVQRDRAAAAFRVSHLGDPNTNLSLWENKIKAAAHAAAKGAEIPKDIRQHGADVIPHELWKAYPKATPKLAAAATHLMDDNVPVDVAGSLAIDVLSGGVASAGAKLGARALEAAGAEAAASTAADEAATQAAKAAERALPQTSKAKVAVKDVIERAKTAPERAAKSVKSAPARTLTKVKTAPARAAISASTSEGRRVAAKAAAEKVLEHRASTAIVAATAAKKAGINAPGINEVGNFGQGLVDAVHHHLGETALTTLRSVPAAITGPAALLGAAGSSITHGTPDPLIKTAKEQAQGVAKIVTDATSSNPKVAERAFTKEGAGALLTPLPAITRTKVFKAAREDVRGAASAVRRGVAEKSDGLNRRVRHAPKGHEEHLTKKGAGRDARKEVVITKARADRPAEVAAAGHTKRIRNAIARAPKGSDAILQAVAEFGIRDKAHADHIRANGPGDKQLLHALDYIDAHPHIFEDKHFKNALKALDSSSRNLPAGKLGLGERARYLPQGDAHGILPPEHRVPHAARALAEGATTREGAWDVVARWKRTEKLARKMAAEKSAQAKVVSDRTPDAVAGDAGRGALAEAIAEVGDKSPQALVDRGAQMRSLEEILPSLKTPHGKPGITIENDYIRRFDSEMPNIKHVVFRGEDGAPIGVLTMHREFQDGSIPNSARITHSEIVVDPAHRRQGIAAKMVLAAHEAGFPIHKIGEGDAHTAEGAALRVGLVRKLGKEGGRQTLDQIEKNAEKRGVRLWVSENDQGIKLDMISVAEGQRGTGAASATLRELTDYADAKGKPIALDPAHPEAKTGGLTTPQLRKWYGRHGFVPNKGRNKDFAFRQAMIRPGRKVKNPTDPGLSPAAQLRREVARHLKDAKTAKTQGKLLTDSLKDFTHPKNNIDRSALKPYDKKLLDEYTVEVRAKNAEHGLADPIYTAHRAADGHHGEGLGMSFPVAPGRVEHMRNSAASGKTLALQDNLDRSLPGLIEHSVRMPRMRAAGKEFVRRLVDRSIPFYLDGKKVRVGQGHGDWTAITQRKTAENPNGGQVSPKEYARFPMRQWKNSLDDPFAPGSKSPKQVVEDALNGKVADEEPWVLLPRQKIEQFASQINPTKGPIPDVLNAFGRVTNRAILATNPAWVLAQAVGEAIPIVLAHPEMAVKGAKARYEFHQWAKKNPEEAWAYQGVIGASPSSSAALRTPTDMRETYTTPDVFDLGAKALTRGRTARAAISVATLRTLGEFDSRRQNEYRTMTALMESDRQFRSFHKGLTSLFDEQAALSRRFRGKSRAEMLDWLTKTDEGKVHLQKIADHVDDVNGNWTAFTHLEQSFAPLVIFYPFLRYSLRWTLWTFPKSHPIAATAAYMMGQANSNQLEKLLGTKPNPLAYSYPVYEGVNGKAVLPGGSRISPGQSVFTNIAFEGNPSQIVGALNPVIGAGVTAATGTGPFGTQALGPRGWAAADQLLSLPGPMRVLLQRTNLDAQTIASKLGIGSPSPPSAFGKAMKQFDPLKDERSLLFPGIPQSAQRFKGEQKLIADETQKYKDPVPSPFTPQVIDAMKAADQGNWGPTKKLIKEHKLSQAAKDRITQAESPFFQDSGGAFGDNAIQALKLIQGGVFIPQTPAELRATASKKSTPFGVGAKSAPSSKSSTPFGL